ncbi:HlyD family type I secretion periplasmic adaptor subunit [Sandaracinobacter sp. RS1-74]|uniref:HlyD family type I secretion periplasmic adaptor subunit n=1 Tax=Sandaracinobacteroides sayramensis TaxID=2913411 RepID=UPI001EDA8B8D|nr:HlyD family type I secretion periplasmic adaptor subunit [Sandaracinobacteroides sayramensis]MCG2842133.1 HlyD family type I secretion periplasmic adaptor subunit [Sandaracinobacteroides sayramensis]
MIETLERHWHVLRASWALDRQDARSRRRLKETEFLPAALEIIETPASPLGRVILWALIALLGVALVWSIVGKLDVVAVAPGKIVPSDRVKVIQPSELGVVRAIHVRDGQRVQAGQLLVELDPTMTGADDAQAARGLMVAAVDRARARALLAHVEGRKSEIAFPADTPADVQAAQRALVRMQISEYEARRSALIQQRYEHEAEREAARAERAKMAETLPLLDQQVEAHRQLVAKGFGSRLKLLQIQEEQLERRRNIEVHAAAVARSSAAVGRIDRELSQLRAEFSREAAQALVEAQDNMSLRGEEITKTQRRRALQRLTAPVDGTVQQLSVHTLGGVVQPAQQLLVVVPESGGLHVESKLLNKDIGFVRGGQPVRIKVEAFPYTEYGVVEGVVSHVGRDAETDEKLGLVYPVRIAIRDGGSGAILLRQLIPGMAVQAEVVTDRRRVIDYLLSPIERTVGTAGRER